VGRHRDADNIRSDEPARPQDGDIVIARESRGSTRYTMRQLPNKAQLSAESQDDAVRLARVFAWANAVNIWYMDGGTLHLLVVYRAPHTPAPLTNANQ
jgi:hypothetical protein